jgi:hypothetical protein
MALTANVYLEINAVTKKGRIVDASNYTAEGISLSALSARGLGVVTGPTGVAIFTGTTVGSPLINLSATTNSVWFNLPLDSNGEILNGTYSFTYSLRYAITAGVVNSVSAPSTFELEFTQAGRVLVAGDSLVTTANTIAANNGTFTVSTAAFDEGLDNSTIVVTQTTLVNEALATGTYSFDVTRAAFAGSTYTWNGCNFATPAVTTTYDCESTQFGQIIFSDTSVIPSGQILVSRSLSGYYPNGLYPEPETNPETTTTSSLTFTNLAVGTWTHVLVLNMSVTQDDGLVYTYTVRDTGETLVTCVGTLCGLTPCIESIKDKYYASFVRGQASGLEPAILMILQLYALAKEYKTCGNTAMYAATVAQLQSVLDNSGECSCGCCDESQDVPYWVDNSNLDATSIIAQLQSEIDALNLQVGGLENAVQNNASALAAYNTLIGNINTYNTDLLTILAELNVVQAAALALNPSSPSFEADVDVLIANVDTIETNFLLLNDQLNDLLVEVVAFNEDYPEFASYTITLYEQLQASAETSVTIQAVIDQLQASLATLTPSTYNDEIEEIWDAIESLQIYFSLLAQQVGIALASIESIQVTLASLIEQNTSLQFEIDTLTAVVNGLNKLLILGFYVDESAPAAVNLFIPADWLGEKIVYKFNIKGTSTDPADVIKLVNTNIATTIFGVAVGNNAYDIQLNMVYVPADLTWKIGGTVNIGGSLAVIGDFTIDPTTLLPFNIPTVINVVGSGVALTNTFYAVDGFAYRQ